MDSSRFDRLTKVCAALSTRRAALGLLAVVGLRGALPDDADAKRRKKKCKNCGPCRKCKSGKCRPKPDGVVCGACASCLTGQCVAGCPDGQTCLRNVCLCPTGQKPCEDGCIDESECCGECPQNQVYCDNVGECKDVRNDPDFCGQCANGACPGGAFCANGACSLSCNTIGQVCFQPSCICSNRVDPAHDGQNACVEIGSFTCDNVPTCNADADCSPGTQGFRQVCVSDICAGKKVCADPCA